MKKINLKTILLLIAIIMTVGFSGSAFFFYSQYQNLKNNPNEIANKEVSSMIEQIEKTVELPDEDPSVLIITDKEKISDEFLQVAENEDRLLIFGESGKVVLYRPSVKKIVDFGFLINTNVDQEGIENSPEDEAQLTVVIYNGTDVSGLADEYQSEIESIEGVTVTELSNAASTTYETTQVFNLSEVDEAIVDELATLVGGQVMTDLPEDEQLPEADILIILGQE